MAAAIAAMAVSCQKENIPTPVVETEPMVITAGVETKTSLGTDGKTINWTSDDVIAVFDFKNVKNEFKTTAVNGASATFEGEVSAGTEQFYAVYPSNLANSASGSSLSVTIPTNQTPAAGTFAEEHNISVAKGVRPLGDGSQVESVVEFKNVCALLKFTLPDYITDATKVTVTSNSVLAGELTINYQDDEPKVTVSSLGSKSISMTGTYAPGSTFWFVVAPGDISGITVDVQTDRATYSMSTTNKYTISAGNYKNLGTLKLSEKISGTASAVHVYDDTGVLQGTNIVLNLSLDAATAQYFSIDQVLKKVSVRAYYSPDDNRNVLDKIGDWFAGKDGVEDVDVNTGFTTTAIANTITVPYVETHPYLPKDILYKVVVSYETNNGTGSFTTDLNVGAPFTGDGVPSLAATYNVYTSYSKYKADGAAKANATKTDGSPMYDGSTIFAERTSINLSNTILEKYKDILTSKLNNTLDVTSGSATRSVGDYIVESIVTTFDGVSSTTETNNGTYYVTGIPYILNIGTDGDKWSKSGLTDGGAVTFAGDHVQITSKASMSKVFYLPTQHDIKVTVTGYTQGTKTVTGWNQYAYDGNTGTVSVNDTPLYTATVSGSCKLLDSTTKTANLSGNPDISFNSGKTTITCSNSSISLISTSYTRIKTLTVTYK